MEAHSCIGVITIFSGAISVFLVTISWLQEADLSIGKFPCKKIKIQLRTLH